MYKLLLVLMLLQGVVAYAMEKDLGLIGLDASKSNFSDQHNKKFRKRLEEIQSNSVVLLSHNEFGDGELTRFTKSEYAQIKWMFDRRRSVLRLHEQDENGLLIYYKHFAQIVLNDVCLEAKAWSLYRKEEKIYKKNYNEYLREIGKLAILVADVESRAPEVNRTNTMDENCKSFVVGLESLFGEVFH